MAKNTASLSSAKSVSFNMPKEHSLFEIFTTKIHYFICEISHSSEMVFCCIFRWKRELERISNSAQNLVFSRLPEPFQNFKNNPCIVYILCWGRCTSNLWNTKYVRAKHISKNQVLQRRWLNLMENRKMQMGNENIENERGIRHGHSSPEIICTWIMKDWRMFWQCGHHCSIIPNAHHHQLAYAMN